MFMDDLVRFDNVVEAIKYLCPGHILGDCIGHDGMAVNYQQNDPIIMPDGRIAFICNTGNMCLYRGENKVYDSCKASLYRIKDREDRILALAKSYEFMEFIKTLPEVEKYIQNKYWYEPWALAQHYEFATPMLDLTNEISVAAFFATHRYDSVAKQYYLVKEGIGQIRLTSMFSYDPLDMKTIRPIGVQPFSRPSNQFGYEYWIDSSDDFAKHSTVIQFKQDHEVNLRLKNAMPLSETNYFPNERITQIASTIKTEKVVTRKAIESFTRDASAEYIKPIVTEDEIKSVLEKEKIFIVDAPVISPEAMQKRVRVFGTDRKMCWKPAYHKGVLLDEA